MEMNFKKTATCPICDRADKLMRKSQYKMAAEHYLSSLFQKNDPVRGIKGASKAFKELKEYDKAIKQLEKAKKLCIFDSEIYYELGLNHLLNAEFCKATKNFIRTIKLEPNNLNAQVQLAISHEMMDEPDMALLIYNKIIEENPEFILAYNHKAGLYMQMEDYIEAAKVFQSILKADPAYFRANLGLGICLDKMGESTSAVRYYKKYIMNNPKSDTTSSLVGRIVEIYSNKNIKAANLKVVS